MKAFDADFLSILLAPDADAPLIPGTDQPLPRAQERVVELVRVLTNAREKIIIPAPALSEVLVLAGTSGSDYLGEITSNSVFSVGPFDERAAVEVAAITVDAIQAGDKRGGVEAAWAKVKFDRQIVAIAKVGGADTLYSNDGGVRSFGERAGLQVISLFDLPEPPPSQIELYEGNDVAARDAEPPPVGSQVRGDMPTGPSGGEPNENGED